MDPNEIAAAALKARLMGDTEKFQQLQQQLAEAKEQEAQGGSGENVVLHELGNFLEASTT